MRFQKAHHHHAATRLRRHMTTWLATSRFGSECARDCKVYMPNNEQKKENLTHFIEISTSAGA